MNMVATQHNNELVWHMYRYTIPAALSLLPGRMDTPSARAMLIAIGLQESDGFNARVQYDGGPAHGFWQFEQGGGVKGVLTHPATRVVLAPVLHELRYDKTGFECYAAIVHNDVLACVFARLLLWTVPGALPAADQHDKGWQQYISGWRPGKPHPATWENNFIEAWRTVLHE